MPQPGHREAVCGPQAGERARDPEIPGACGNRRAEFLTGTSATGQSSCILAPRRRSPLSKYLRGGV